MVHNRALHFKQFSTISRTKFCKNTGLPGPFFQNSYQFSSVSSLICQGTEYPLHLPAHLHLLITIALDMASTIPKITSAAGQYTR